jgi:hypothetical protein
MANYPQKQFYGTAQTIINTATDIAAGNFSGAPSATFDNTTDAAVSYAEYAVAMGEFPDWAAAPTTPALIELWGVLIDTDGTDDDTDAPSGTTSNGARYFGSWVMAGVDALQRRTITISLLGAQKVDFYIKNGTSQNMNNDGGTNCVVKVTPFSLGITV